MIFEDVGRGERDGHREPTKDRIPVGAQSVDRNR